MGAARGDEKWNVAPFRNANWLPRKPADRYTHFHARFRGLFIPPVVNVLVKREVETWRRHRRRQPRDNCLNAATNQPASFSPILLDVRNLTRYAKASWESRLLIVLGNERPSTVNPCHPSSRGTSVGRAWNSWMYFDQFGDCCTLVLIIYFLQMLEESKFYKRNSVIEVK